MMTDSDTTQQRTDWSMRWVCQLMLPWVCKNEMQVITCSVCFLESLSIIDLWMNNHEHCIHFGCPSIVILTEHVIVCVRVPCMHVRSIINQVIVLIQLYTHQRHKTPTIFFLFYFIFPFITLIITFFTYYNLHLVSDKIQTTMHIKITHYWLFVGCELPIIFYLFVCYFCSSFKFILQSSISYLSLVGTITDEANEPPGSSGVFPAPGLPSAESLPVPSTDNADADGSSSLPLATNAPSTATTGPILQTVQNAGDYNLIMISFYFTFLFEKKINGITWNEMKH